jgi:hypothetical protein
LIEVPNALLGIAPVQHQVMPDHRSQVSAIRSAKNS